MKMKDIKWNMLINAVKGLLSILFPFITFPYIARVLQAEGIGQFNFASSIVSYFILIAGLGISTYASCEGPKYREDRVAASKFASEIFSINVLSALVAYVLLLLCLILVKKLQGYTALILVLSVQIVFQTLGKEWLCTIYEDYTYLAVRYVVFQIISIAALFMFVQDTGDCLIYAFVAVLSATGANIVNYFRVKTFCDVSFVLNRNMLQHMKPILVFFATAIAVTIYVNSDMTILGFLGTDADVGIYSVSVKVYTIIKSVLASAVAVVIPRMAAMSSNADREGIAKTAKEVFEIVFTITLPALVGIIVLAEEIVFIIAGEAYLAAALSLKILSLALLFCMLGYFWGQCVLYPYRQEAVVFKGTVICALVNVVLNFLLIPLWKQNAAALTTVISEGLSAMIFMYFGRKYINISGTETMLLKIIVGCFCIVLIDIWMALLIENVALRVMGTIMGSVVIYLVVELLVKNESVCSILKVIAIKITRRE